MNQGHRLALFQICRPTVNQIRHIKIVIWYLIKAVTEQSSLYPYLLTYLYLFPYLLLLLLIVYIISTNSPGVYYNYALYNFLADQDISKSSLSFLPSH